MNINLKKTAIIGILKASLIGMLCFGQAFAATGTELIDNTQKQSQTSSNKGAGEKTADTKDDKININTGNSETLQKLPRIGPKMAQRIIEFRQEHGEFKSLEEVMNVKGIGPKTYEALKSLIKL